MAEPITLKKEKKAVKTIEKWAGAGEDAYRTVQKIEAAKLHDEPVELTSKEKSALVRGAVRMFLDGNMSNKTKKLLSSKGLDPDNLRKSIVEETMPNTIELIKATGDIERLIALGDLAGEKPESDIPQGAKRILRERVIIEIED